MDIHKRKQECSMPAGMHKYTGYFLQVVQPGVNGTVHITVNAQRFAFNENNTFQHRTSFKPLL